MPLAIEWCGESTRHHRCGEVRGSVLHVRSDSFMHCQYWFLFNRKSTASFLSGIEVCPGIGPTLPVQVSDALHPRGCTCHGIKLRQLRLTVNVPLCLVLSSQQQTPGSATLLFMKTKGGDSGLMKTMADFCFFWKSGSP